MTENPPPPPQPAAPQPMSESDERLYASLAHAGIILFGFLPPLIIWLVFRERSAYLNDQGKESLNFSILVTIVYVALSIVGGITLGLGFLLYPIVWIGVAIICIMAAIATNKGQMYRYPFNWRLIK